MTARSRAATPRVAVSERASPGWPRRTGWSELAPGTRFALFERFSRLGGVLSTVHEQGFQVEQSADNFITTVPYGLDLCRRLGLADQLVQTDPRIARPTSSIAAGSTSCPTGS